MEQKINEQRDIRKLNASKHQTKVSQTKADLKNEEDSKSFELDE